MARNQVEQRVQLPYEQRKNIFFENRGICAHCGKHLSLQKDFTVEHVIPLHKGGSNSPDNLIALCQSCNQEKSDDVVDPATYYPYLPEAKMAKVKAVFQQYSEEIDYLGYDNLLPLDQFTLVSRKPIVQPKTKKVFFVPVKLQITKMRTNEILDFLLIYGAHLSPGDKNLLLYRKEQITYPFYMVKQGETPLMVFSTHIKRNVDYLTPCCPTPIKRDMINIDMFADPNVSVSINSINCMSLLVFNIEQHIQGNLRKRSSHTVIEAVINTPHSDRLMSEGFKCLSDWNKTFYRVCGQSTDGRHIVDEFPEDEYTVSLNALLFQGKQSEMKKYAQANGCDTLADFDFSKIAPQELSRSHSEIEARLSEAKDLRTFDPKNKVKKKDKKHSSKPHHKR